MSDFIIQNVNELLRSSQPEDIIRGAALFRSHNLTVAPSFSYKAGCYPVWRPYLKADSICGVCYKEILANTVTALWGGKKFHFSCWHIDCWQGQYDVNTADRATYKTWLTTTIDPAIEETRWHKIT